MAELLTMVMGSIGSSADKALPGLGKDWLSQIHSDFGQGAPAPQKGPEPMAFAPPPPPPGQAQSQMPLQNNFQMPSTSLGPTDMFLKQLLGR